MYIYVYIYIYIYLSICIYNIYNIYIYIYPHIRRHVFRTSQDSSVKLESTSREQMMSQECSKQVAEPCRLRVASKQT